MKKSKFTTTFQKLLIRSLAAALLLASMLPGKWTPRPANPEHPYQSEVCNEKPTKDRQDND